MSFGKNKRIPPSKDGGNSVATVMITGMKHY